MTDVHFFRDIRRRVIDHERPLCRHWSHTQQFISHRETQLFGKESIGKDDVHETRTGYLKV